MKCISELRKSAAQNKQEGYMVDWADKMFRVHTLELLTIIAENSYKQKKKLPSEYNLFMKEQLDNGFSMKEATEIWNKKKLSVK